MGEAKRRRLAAAAGRNTTKKSDNDDAPVKIMVDPRAKGAMLFPAIVIDDPDAASCAPIRPDMVKDFFKGTMQMVDAIHFDIGPHEGLAGKCMQRTLAAYQAIRASGVNVKIVIGGVLVRVGPHPRDDVVAFCGPHNMGGFVDGLLPVYHCWIEYNNEWVFDPSVGDWNWNNLNEVAAETMMFGRALPAIHWDVTLPKYWVKPVVEVVGEWQPTGTPELGKAWYGPFRGSSKPLEDALMRLHREHGLEIARTHANNFNAFAERHGYSGHKPHDDTVYPLQFMIRFGGR